jgi:hypothetical protein
MRMKWTGHVQCREEKRNVYRVLMEKTVEKRTLEV